MGWAKATKLAGRTALQGLVAVKFDKNHGALVELNCETDFVAKNDKFQKMIEDAAIASFKFAHTKLQAKGPITKVSVYDFITPQCSSHSSLHHWQWEIIDKCNCNITTILIESNVKVLKIIMVFLSTAIFSFILI